MGGRWSEKNPISLTIAQRQGEEFPRSMDVCDVSSKLQGIQMLHVI